MTPRRLKGHAARRGLWMVIVLLLLAAYALPVFVPPAAAPVTPLAPDATLVERLFPGVPGWWEFGRLFCLLAAVALAVWRGPDGPSLDRLPATDTDDRDPRTRRRLWLALGSAGLQAGVGLWAFHFGRAMQLLYIAWFAVPALLLVRWRKPLVALRRTDLRMLLTVAGIVGVWLLLRVPAAWRSPRAADISDTWVGVRFLTDAADPAFNLLTGRFQPGGGSLHFVFQGTGIVQLLGIHPSFQLAQVAQFLWLAVAGLGVGLLAGRLAGIAAASVATAAFLFSPFVLMMLVAPLPFFFYQLVTVGLVVLLVKVHDDRSLPALVALGALAGIGATLHSANLVSVVVLCVALWSARQPPRLPTRGTVIAILLFAAALITALSDIEAIRSMVFAYTGRRAQWAAHEMAAFGQISPGSSEYAVEAAIPRPFDTPLSGLLAPFVMPRIPLRALGDALFDPLGSVLSALGIAVCVRAARTSWCARVLLGVLALSLPPAFVSSQDRLSVIRLVVTTVPMALLAGIGWETVRRWMGPAVPTAPATSVVTLAIALGGTAVFDCINPRILPSSSTSLTLRALAHNTPPGGAVVLNHPKPNSFPYWYLNEIMAAIPRQPIGIRVYEQPDSLLTDSGKDQAVAELLFWNPGLEEDQHVSRAVCQRWPGAALYTLIDAANRSRAFAARPQGPGWRPALPDRQWRVGGCGTVLETEATWAAAVLHEARAALADGQQGEAVALLRTAVRRNFAQADLFEATARAMLDAPGDAGLAPEAAHWARRACQVTRFHDPDAIGTLAAAYAATGQLHDAIDAARQAREVAVAQGNQELVTRLDAHLRAYERSLQSR